MDEESFSICPNPCGWVLLYHPIKMSKDGIWRKPAFSFEQSGFFISTFYLLKIQIKINVFKEVSLNNEKFYFN
jgi:hypothetical protein